MIIGKFKVTSGRIRVTDPCYGPDVQCVGSLNARNGIWTAEIVTDDYDGWGIRVGALIVRHEDYPTAEPLQSTSFDIGVDSGQCGFFDEEQYASQGWSLLHSKFYDAVCALTGSQEQAGIVPEFGAVSASGLGDGSYKCYITEADNGEIVAAQVIFIYEDDMSGSDVYEDDDDEDDDEDDDWGDDEDSDGPNFEHPDE
jgi:hypothetical protein